MVFQSQTLEHVEEVIENLENEKRRLERRIARQRALPVRHWRRVRRLKVVRQQLLCYQRVFKHLKRSVPLPLVEPVEITPHHRGYLIV